VSRDAFPIGLALQGSIVIGGPGIKVIDKSDIMPDKYIVLQNHAFTDESVAGDFAAGTDAGAFLNLNKGANLHVIPDLAAVEIGEGVNSHAFAHFYVGRYPLVERGLRHDAGRA
jgi:hypothetical protein